MKLSKKTISREEFSAALKMHRARLGYRQQDAAEACRVSLRVWADWERVEGGAPLYPTMRGVLEILKFAPVKK